MVVHLVGVWDDGAFLGAGVPANPRVPVRLTQGASLKVKLSVVTRAGQAVQLDLDPTVTLALTIKRNTGEMVAVLAASGVLVPTEGYNRADFLIAADATKFVEPGRYLYDVWMVYLGERNAVVPTSPFLLEPSVAPVP